MEQYIKKSALVAEIEKRIKEISKEFQESKTIQYTLLGKINALENLLPFLDTLEVKEINNVWHDARRTIPEDGSEQIICIKEDGLAVSTVGKIVNGTIKWAYLGDLLNINSFNVEGKEVDLEKEIEKEWLNCDLCRENTILEYANMGIKKFRTIAKHFFELGLKAQKGE